MYRHQKNAEESSAEKKTSSVASDSESEKKSDIEGETDKMEVATITSTKAEIRASTSPKPDVVSSTLTPPKEPKSKSLAMLLQIFPGKPQKILEAKLREAKGDVVKALELCAKYFDQFESPPKNVPKTQPKIFENNNVTTSETAAKFFPPPLMAAAALHKSAFVPAPPSVAANPPASNFYPRGFEPPNFFSAKELFPFPPPLFPPSFFVGFSSNPSAYHHAAAAASLNSPNFSLPAPTAATAAQHCVRPCVDPLCGQCAPKVDSTAEDTTVQETEDL